MVLSGLPHGRGRLLLLSISLMAATASLLINWHTLRLLPHVPDETSYSFQGLIFATGKLSLPPPPVPEAFFVDHILTLPDRWCSIYPPGWPLMLAAGWLIHAPWIVNPLLLALTILGIWLLASRAYDLRTAWLASILFAASPFVLFMYAGFMSHGAALCVSVWCLATLITENRKSLFYAGLFAGLAFLIRPYSAAALLAPAFVWKFFQAENKRDLLPIAVGTILPAALFLLYNHVQFGSAITSGYLFDPGWKPFDYRYFGEKIAWYFRALNQYMWGWPWPDLLIFLPLLLPRSKWRLDLMLIACCGALLAAYSIFYYSDIVYAGPRYAFEMMGFVAILAARAIRILIEKIRNQRYANVTLITAIVVLPLILRLPSEIDYHSAMYHGQDGELAAKVSTSPDGSLVLISGDRYVYRSFFFENFQGKNVFVIDVKEKREQILKAFPGKDLIEVYIELSPLPGRNNYTDRWQLKTFRERRL